MRHTLKVILGATLAGLFLFLSATPSGAVGNSFTLTSGSIVTNVQSFPVGSSGTPPCPGTPGTLAIDVDTSNTATEITAFSSTGSFTFFGSTYFAVLSKAGSTSDNSGTMSGGGGVGSTITTGFKVQAVIYREASPAGSCTIGAARCTVNATWTALGGEVTSGAFTSGDASTGTEVELDGTANSVTKTACSFPFSLISSVGLQDVVITAV